MLLNSHRFGGALGTINILRDGMSLSSVSAGPTSWWSFTASAVYNGNFTDYACFTYDQLTSNNNGRGVTVQFTRQVKLGRWKMYRLTTNTVFDLVTEYFNGSIWVSVGTLPNLPGGDTTNPRNFDVNPSRISSSLWRCYVSNWQGNLAPITNFYLYELEAYEIV